MVADGGMRPHLGRVPCDWKDRVLDRDRATGGRHRRDDQRRDMARAERQAACRGGRPAATDKRRAAAASRRTAAP